MDCFSEHVKDSLENEVNRRNFPNEVGEYIVQGSELIEQRVSNLFNKLNLPEPKLEQYIPGQGASGIVFMNQAGIVIRGMHDTINPLLRHRHLMRPLGSVMIAGNCRMDFQYAGMCPVSPTDYNNARGQLTNKGLAVADLDAENMLYIGNKQQGGDAILFDPRSISIKYNSEQYRNFTDSRVGESHSDIIDLTPLSNEEADEQDNCFADLREKFVAMFDVEKCVNTVETHPEVVSDFWQAAIEARKQEHLYPSWLDNKYRNGKVAKKRVIPISNNYAQALAEYNPVFA